MPTPTHIAPRKDSDVFFMSLLAFLLPLNCARYVLFYFEAAATPYRHHPQNTCRQTKRPKECGLFLIIYRPQHEHEI